jgi:hypothetical protein
MVCLGEFTFPTLCMQDAVSFDNRVHDLNSCRAVLTEYMASLGNRSKGSIEQLREALLNQVRLNMAKSPSIVQPRKWTVRSNISATVGKLEAAPTPFYSSVHSLLRVRTDVGMLNRIALGLKRLHSTFHLTTRYYEFANNVDTLQKYVC